MGSKIKCHICGSIFASTVCTCGKALCNECKNSDYLKCIYAVINDIYERENQKGGK